MMIAYSQKNNFVFEIKTYRKIDLPPTSKPNRLLFFLHFSPINHISPQSKKERTLCPFQFCAYVRWLFAVAQFQTAAAKQQCAHQQQAGGVDAKVKVSHFTATATQKQQNEQNPGAVATAKCRSALTAIAVAIVKQSVEHLSYLLFRLTYHSLFYNTLLSQKVLQYLHTNVKSPVDLNKTP